MSKNPWHHFPLRPWCHLWMDGLCVRFIFMIIKIVIVNSVFYRFGVAKFDYNGLSLCSSQFLPLPQLPQNLILDTVWVRDCDVHKQRNRTAIFFSFFLLCPDHFLKIHQKKLRPVPICWHAFVIPGMHFSLYHRVFVFPGARLPLYKGHNPWHILYINSQRSFKNNQLVHWSKSSKQIVVL